MLLTVCSGSQCLVEDSSNEIFLEASDVPSIILSAFQSAQRQHQHFPGSSASVHSRNGSHHNVTASKSTSDGCEPQSSTADNATERDSEQCPKRHSPSPHTLVETRQRWRPLLLVIPLRLGLSEINPVYFSAVKVDALTCTCTCTLSVILLYFVVNKDF